MSEKLVDVVNAYGSVIHTYPVDLPDTDSLTHVDFEAKALEAAHFGTLAADNEYGALTTRIHVRREGAMEPYDAPPKDSQSKMALEEDIRLRAYHLWEAKGRTHSAEENWWNATDEHLRERAYRLWKSEGSPQGQSDTYWYRAVRFEEA